MTLNYVSKYFQCFSQLIVRGPPPSLTIVVVLSATSDSHNYAINDFTRLDASFTAFLFFLDAPAQPAVKEEVISRASSEQGEEEMEVESADEQEEDARSQSGQTNSQVSRSNSTGATFNTLSTLGSLRPGIYDTHFHHSTYLKGLSSQEHFHDSLLAL